MYESSLTSAIGAKASKLCNVLHHYVVVDGVIAFESGTSQWHKRFSSDAQLLWFSPCPLVNTFAVVAVDDS